MDVRELATRIDARIYPGAREPGPHVRFVHSANTMSGLIANASPDTLLVTALNNRQLIRAAWAGPSRRARTAHPSVEFPSTCQTRGPDPGCLPTGRRSS